jgi:hypothetical protein
VLVEPAKICYLVSTTPGVQVTKFAACIVDTGGKFAGVVDAGGKLGISVVVDTGGAPSLEKFSANFRKNLKCPNIIFGGLGEDDS